MKGKKIKIFKDFISIKKDKGIRGIQNEVEN